MGWEVGWVWSSLLLLVCLLSASKRLLVVMRVCFVVLSFFWLCSIFLFCKCLCGRFVEFHTKFDSVPLFDIFLHRECNEVVKHDHTQTAVAHDWFNQSIWNKYGQAAKVTTNAPIYINEVLHYQFVHRKISTLTFGTNFVCVCVYIYIYTVFPGP